MLNIPEYQVTEQLFASHQSLIYRGVHEKDRRPIVFKVLNREYPTPEEMARFRREYTLTRQTKGDGIIEAYHLISHENTLVIVLEDFGAESLASRLVSPTWEMKQFLSLSIRLTEILAQIHQGQIIHKDINPSNILWNSQTDQVKVIDFGISTELSREMPSLRNPNQIEGTLAYMSPEQTGRMNRAMDYRTDFYSLGVTLYEMLTSQLPFQAKDAMELVHSHLAKEPPPPHLIKEAIPPILSAIVMKLLRKTPEERYQSAFGLKVDLSRCWEQLQAQGGIEIFSIGEQDSTDKFQIPQKLYGRQKEVARLLAAFERVSQGAKEIMLVAGYSGIGKSALVHEIQRPILEKQGYFLSGKFDQFQRKIPYSALIQAFQELVKQLLMESEEQLIQWKEQLSEALGINGQVVIEVIPEVELIIGPQPSLPSLPVAEANNRFKIVFQNFVRIFTSRKRPLVLFLDDLQWADLPSLDLMKDLVRDVGIQSLFFIGAYRDNEVDAAHPLMLNLDEVSQSNIPLDTVTLHPLKESHVNQLLSETLKCDPEVSQPLAELCLKKTDGNPFFLGQFLQALYEKEVIAFEESQGKWQWTMDFIEAMEMTDNVVELMIGQLQRLPENTQTLLQLAACIGGQFDLETLTLVNEQTSSETARILWNALKMGLVLPLDEDYKFAEQGGQNATYKFLHDRVQQAAYSLIEEEHKQAVHYKIGRILLENHTEDLSNKRENIEEHLFDIVNHLNMGKTLIREPLEREQLAEFNLLAGKKAKVSSAYQPALTYLETGLALLESDPWGQQYELSLNLHIEAAEAAYLSKNYERMEELTQFTLQKAQSVLDRTKIMNVHISALIAQNQYLEAIEEAIPVLKQLGVRLPKNPGKHHVLAALLKTKIILSGKKEEDFLNLPTTSDPHMKAAAPIFDSIGFAALFVSPNLTPLIIFTTVNHLVFKYGNSVPSILAYAGYGYILSGVLGEVEASDRFVRIALKLWERSPAQEIKSQLWFVINVGVTPWKEPLQKTLKPLQEGYQAGLETGGLFNAGNCALLYLSYAFFAGKKLERLEQEAEKYTIALEQFQIERTLHIHQTYYQTILNLKNQTENPTRLLGTRFDEEKTLPFYLKSQDQTVLFTFYFYKLMLCYLFQDPAEAVRNADLAEKYSGVLAGIYSIVMLHFYGALARIAAFPEVSQTEKRRSLKKVAQIQKKMKKWAQNAPMNFLHKWHLIEAERARLLKKDETALTHYDQAIQLAKTHGFLQEEALAFELLGRFWLEKNKPDIAQLYLRRAHHRYQIWGATAKVRHLEETYPSLLSLLPERADFSSTTIGTSISASGSTETLDLTTVMKASQSLSGEIDLQRLLEHLIQIMIENAGAQRGCLLLKKDDQFFVEASGSTEARNVEVLQTISFENYLEIPKTLILYVIRTLESVVLHNASNEEPFMTDPYIAQTRSKSALCIPILHQGNLTSVLYLENNLVSGAFTEDRLEVLTLLSGQIAISIENAKLYRENLELIEELKSINLNLEQKVEERTEALQRSLQAIQNFYHFISHELRTPISAIQPFIRFLTKGMKCDPPTESQLAHLRIIDNNMKRVMKLANQILDLARIESETAKPVPQSVEIHPLVRRSVEKLRGLFHQDTEVKLELQAPETPVLAVWDDLETVLENLISNAAKYTRAGSVRIKTEQVGQGIKILVMDTGVGIDSDKIDLVFERFTRLDQQQMAKGTGLGLSITKTLVERMGGQIGVTSKKEEGATFWLWLPLA